MHITTIKNLNKPLVVGKDKQLFCFTKTIPNGEIMLKKNSNLTLVGLITKGWNNNRHLIIRAKETGAKCEVIFFILGEHDSNFSSKLEAIHQAPNTKIKINIRTALTDTSSCHIEGNCIIEKNAKGANTYFADHTLLLSEKAIAKTSPNLEIKTDDVKAGHSASVGKIDEEALFYLLSRGLTEAQARALLVQGFFEKEIENIPDKKIQEIIRKTVKNFLL